jgi:hypothetical protein
MAASERRSARKKALRRGDRAEAAMHAEPALHFYESVAATRYADQMRSLGVTARRGGRR